MKLPEREYYTIQELAVRWNTTERHILELILNRHLDAVALVAANGTHFFIVDGIDSEAHKSFIDHIRACSDCQDSLGGYCEQGEALRTEHQQKGRHLLEFKTWYDIDLLFDLYTKGYSSISEYFESNTSSYRFEPPLKINTNQLLVTNSEISRFEACNEREDEKEQPPIERRERDSYLKLIKLLCQLNDLDISQHYKAYEVIAAAAAAKGIEMPISKNNAAPKLKAARDID